MHPAIRTMFLVVALLAPAHVALGQAMPGQILLTENIADSVVDIRPGGDLTGAPRLATGVNLPTSICVGPGGDVFVTEYSVGEVTIITAGGDFTGAPAFATGLGQANILVCDASEILVGGFAGGAVLDITAGGDFTAAPPFAFGLGTLTGLFRDSNGTLWAYDVASGGRILDITAGGDFTGVPGFATGTFAIGLAERAGSLLATTFQGPIIDWTAGGDFAVAPVFAEVPTPVGLLDAGPLGLFVTTITPDVYEVSAGGDFTSGPVYATGTNTGPFFSGLTYVPGCGSGVVDAAEECDDGNTIEGDGCDASCVLEICGNGLIQPAAGEECDDGGTVDFDGCSSLCLVESCGDGTVQPSEGCDDGNTIDGDGCDSMCLDETCGNSVVQSGESCDDGNTASEDGCSSACVDEFCGDGTLQTGLGEVCDDGNTTDGDGCSANCTAVTFCSVAPSPSCASAAKASLKIIEKKAGHERLKLSLKKFDAATSATDFGDPVSGTTAYEICIFDAAGSRVASLAVDQAGATCGSKPCWKTTKTGYAYKNRDKASDGVKRISARPGEPGKGKLSVEARNRANRDQTALPTGVTLALEGTTSATVQVVTSDASCFAATLTTVKKADANQFKAKAP